MSNTERQRRFRKRHPGYYQRLHAKRRAGGKAAVARQRAEHQLKMAALAKAWREAIVPPVRTTHLLPAAIERISISEFIAVRPREHEMAVLREEREPALSAEANPHPPSRLRPSAAR